jgi:glutaredoxin-like YruB-family protein
MTDEIKVYSTPSCPYCNKLKNWLDEQGYEYTDYNVNENQEKAKEMIERTRQRGVPQTFIGDEEVIGFQPEKIKEIVEGEEANA